jgi:hypothetical protein
MQNSYGVSDKLELFDNRSDCLYELSSSKKTLNSLSCKEPSAKKKLEKKNDRNNEACYFQLFI